MYGFLRILRFLLLCRTDVLVIVSNSLFDAENDGEVRFTLCWVVVEEGIASTCSVCPISQQLLNTEYNGLRRRSQRQKLSQKQSLKRMFYEVAKIGKSG